MKFNWTKGSIAALRALTKDGKTDAEAAAALVEKYGGSLTDVAVCKKRHSIGVKKPAAGGDLRLPDSVEELDAHGRIAALKGQVKLLLGEKRRLAKRVGQLQNVRDLVTATVVPLRKQTQVYKPRKAGKDKRAYPVCLNLGDWHIPEVITNVESGDWGEYNFKIATQRIYRLADKFLQWVTVQRHGYRINELHVNIVSDLVSGDIHEELKITNEFPLPVAMVKVGYLLAQLIGALAPNFTKVFVHYAGRDNHGRLTKKPQYKQAALNNANYVVSSFAREMLREQKNVEVEYLLSSPGLIQIAGSNVLLMHGDQIKAYMGIPFYGIERMRAREAIKANKRGTRTEWIFCGHFHTFAQLPGVMMNGALCGTNEMDATLGRISPPSQISFMWHPEHGPFNVVNWNLAKAG
jgi:hypothetical protein